MANKQVDYLIVGQGIAGSLLAWFLNKEGKSILVIDAFGASSASRVAAGIINPVTGKRSVKSWRIDELLPFAEKTYHALEKEQNVSFFSSKNIYNYFSNEEDLHFYREKKDSDELKGFIQPLQEQENPFIDNSLGGTKITNAFHLDFPCFIESFKNWLMRENMLLDEQFEYASLELQQGKAVYKDIKAEKVIFCEGVKGMGNPYFNWLPFNPVKGEILTVRIKGLPEDNIFKKGVFILPIGKEIFKVGSTYNWDYEDAQPTEKGKQELINRLKKALKLPFEILDHQAAIRPSVKDRRPLLGLHPEHTCLGIFNGLGTKGASLGPFFAAHLVDFLENQQELDKEVDIIRFISNFPTR